MRRSRGKRRRSRRRRRRRVRMRRREEEEDAAEEEEEEEKDGEPKSQKRLEYLFGNPLEASWGPFESLLKGFLGALGLFGRLLGPS
eukprot:6231561-Pyramimonas_sp.AAC.1